MSRDRSALSVRVVEFSLQRISRKRTGVFAAVSVLLPVSLGIACSDAEDTLPAWARGAASGNGGGVGSGGVSAGAAAGRSGETTGISGAGGVGAAANGGASNPNAGSNSSGNAAAGSNASGGAALGGSMAVGGTAGSVGVAGQGGGPGGKGGTTAQGGSKASGGSGTAGKSASGGSSGAGAAGNGGAASGDRSTAAGVCSRWKADRANLSEGTWSGDAASCTLGDISADGRANALRLYNLYRWLGDLPAVATEASRDRQAQSCALMQEANGTLSHTPPMSWRCWTQEGADGSSSSNISGGPGVQSVDLYLVDSGNETTFGHRRWILSNSLGPIGLGSTATGSSCMQNLRGTGKAGKLWMAWPAPGIFPLQAIKPGRASIDTTGWSLQSDTINLAGAAVSVTANGTAAPVTVSQLAANYGARYAIRILPNGWTSQAGTTYAVSVTGIATPISYQVEVVDCP